MKLDSLLRYCSDIWLNSTDFFFSLSNTQRVMDSTKSLEKTSSSAGRSVRDDRYKKRGRLPPLLIFVPIANYTPRSIFLTRVQLEH